MEYFSRKKELMCRRLEKMGTQVPFPGGDWPLKDQFMGLEVEIEYKEQPESEVFAFWDTKTDGSLRNGIEFVTNGPLLGVALSNSIKELAHHMKKNSENIEYSFRTSIHVHMDMNRKDPYIDLAPFDDADGVISVLTTYLALEDLFFMSAGNDRRYSGFCIPLQDLLPEIGRNLSDMVVAEYDDFHNTGHHLCVNLSSLNKFGTLEFRHMEYTSDEARIREWVSTLMRLKKFAYTYVHPDSKETKYNFLKSLDGLEEAAQYIFNDPHLVSLLDKQVVSERMETIRQHMHINNVLRKEQAKTKKDTFDFLTSYAERVRRIQPLTETALRSGTSILFDSYFNTTTEQPSSR